METPWVSEAWGEEPEGNRDDKRQEARGGAHFFFSFFSAPDIQQMLNCGRKSPDWASCQARRRRGRGYPPDQ